MSPLRNTLLGRVLIAGLFAGLLTGPAVGVASAKGPSGPAGIDRDHPVSAARAQAIDKAAERFLARSADEAPGLWLAVWDPQRGYYEQAYGSAVVGGRAARINDVGYIGSITKTAFATAVLQQVSNGTIKLTDTVADLDPALAAKFPSIAAVDVRNLLGMTSGIPDYAEAAVQQILANPNTRFSRNDLIELGLSSGPQQPVGTPEYSTTNYIIVGKMLQAATGRTPERLVNQVLRQAGMTNSRLPRPNASQPNRIAHGYLGELLASQLRDVEDLELDLDATTDVTSWRFDWGREGGGAYATIRDLAAWGNTCLGNSLLPNKSVRQRMTWKTASGVDYGLGLIKEGDWLSHTGQTLGWSANVACNSSTGAVVAYMINSSTGVSDFAELVGPAAFPEYLRVL